ncbi:MAG: hypothetical protein JWM80_6121 [Cyanobacteria bacterium RYN_339]|nr:hypothetical protein [Cyanobacteria bacterium RYN_339]
MRAFVDKVEGKQAELRLGEDEDVVLVLPVAELPKGVKEGDVLELTFTMGDALKEAAATDEQRRRLLEKSKDEPF